MCQGGFSGRGRNFGAEQKLCQSNFEEDQDIFIRITEVDNDSCLSFEQTKALSEQCEDDVSQ